MKEKYLLEVVATALAQIEYDGCAESIKKMRKESVSQLLPIFLEFHNQGFIPDLVKTAFEKKIAFVLQATTSAEIKEIMKMSVPYYNYEGVVPKGQYHVEEEELMLWFGIVPYCKLKPEANDRISFLFSKFFPKEAPYVLNRI